MKKLKLIFFYLTLLVAFFIYSWMQDPKANLYYRIPNANDYRDIKDTIIDVQVKEMYIENKTKDTLSELSTNNAFSRALWSNGILFHSLEQKGVQPTKIAYKDRIVVDSIYKSVLEIKEVEKKLGWWDNMFIWIGRTLFWVLIIGFIGFIFWIFKNK